MKYKRVINITLESNNFGKLSEVDSKLMKFVKYQGENQIKDEVSKEDYVNVSYSNVVKDIEGVD